MARRTPKRTPRGQSRPRRIVAAQTPLSRALTRVHADLTALEVPYALVGGLAVSARANPRLTRDVDVAVTAKTDETAEQYVSSLVGRRYRVVTTVEQTKTGRLATVRLKSPHETLVVDVLFASSGIEPEIVEAAEILEVLPGLAMPVARSGHLIAMKLLARDDRERPQDLDDIRALLEVATPADRRLVTTAIGQITRRGYARGRDLRALWKEVST